MQLQITHSQKVRGILAVIAASLMFGLGYTFGDIVIAEGMSETCNGLWTAIFSIAANVTISLLRKKNPFKRIAPKQIALCIVCGVLALWLSNVMFLVAYKYMEVAEVTMLHFLYPSFIAVFMTVMFRETFTKAKLAAIISSIIGMLIITGGLRLAHPIGLVAAISTGFFYAVYPVLLETTSLRDIDSSTVVVYMNIVSGISALAVSTATGKFMLPVNGTVLFCQIAVALTGLAGFLLTAFGVKLIGATNASFGSMLEPIASCIFASLVLGQTLGANVIVGAMFIVLSIFFTSLRDLPVKGRHQKRREMLTH